MCSKNILRGVIPRAQPPQDEGLSHNTSKFPQPAKVMAEGEENAQWMVEERKDEHQLWPETNRNNGPLFIPLTSSWFPSGREADGNYGETAP